MSVSSIFYYPGIIRSPRFTNLFSFNLGDSEDNLEMNMISFLMNQNSQFHLTKRTLHVFQNFIDFKTHEEFAVMHKLSLSDNSMTSSADARIKGIIKSKLAISEDNPENNLRVISETFGDAQGKNGIYITVVDS